jgi:prepilin-type N-terminal cleavage/methylation domain-containing protein/prepilin-type processing-associated H-X9-DG protein
MSRLHHIRHKSGWDPSIHRGTTGFTLLELLAVIAIIVILGALLIPVSQKVIAAADNIKCVKNTRHLGSALLAYAADNNGEMYYPPYGGAWWQDPKFSAPYLGISQSDNVPQGCVWCPTGARLNAGYTANTSPTQKRHTSYGLNYNVVSVSTSNYAQQGFTITTPRRLQALPAHSKLILAAEGLGMSAISLLNSNRPDYHPGGTYNAVFLDGHMEALDRTVVDRGKPAWAAYTDPAFYSE